MEVDLSVKAESETDTDNSADENSNEQKDVEMDEDKEDEAATDNKEDEFSADPSCLELIKNKIKKKVAAEFARLIKEGKLGLTDIDEKSMKFLANLRAEDGVLFARHFEQMMSKRHGMADPANRAALMVHQIALLRLQLRRHNRAYLQEPVGGPDAANINALLQRTGYELNVAGTHRVYGAPPPGWEGDEPNCGNNVYVCGFPRDMYEDELVPLFEKYGRIWALRIFVSPLNNYGRGFCFLTYCTQDEAEKAVEQLNNVDVREGHTLKVNLNHPHSTLFLKSLPGDKTDEEIKEEFEKKAEGITNVRIMRCMTCPDVKDIPVAAFLSFADQKQLGIVKRSLAKGEVQIFDRQVECSQADTRGKPEEDCLNKVTEIHVHDMPETMDADQLRTKFGVYGEVKRVSKAGDHAIVFFMETDGAVKAMVALKGLWRQTSTIFNTSTANNPSTFVSPSFCTVETGLGQDFGKIIIDISLGVSHKKPDSPPKQAQKKTNINKDMPRRGTGRGRPGRGSQSVRSRGSDRGRRGLLPLPGPAHQPFRGPQGGLMPPPPPFGYVPTDRMGFAKRTSYDDMDYDYYPRYHRDSRDPRDHYDRFDRFGLDGYRREDHFSRPPYYNDFGDYGGYRSHTDQWQNRWGDFDLPSVVGPRDFSRRGWQERGGYPRGTGRGPNKRKTGGWVDPSGKKTRSPQKH